MRNTADMMLDFLEIVLLLAAIFCGAVAFLTLALSGIGVFPLFTVFPATALAAIGVSGWKFLQYVRSTAE